MRLQFKCIAQGIKAKCQEKQAIDKDSRGFMVTEGIDSQHEICSGSDEQDVKCYIQWTVKKVSRWTSVIRQKR
jgi:hypothetical protein